MHAESGKGIEGGLNATELAASLTVKDLVSSSAWYNDVLGFTIVQRYEREGRLRAVSVRAGQARLLLSEDDGGRGAGRVMGAGFSLQFTTAQDIDALAERIKARGGALETEPATMPWGVRMFRVKDPDGFRFTISS
jgi:uncharacterized glyoxalase superfamily protein PhnB